MFEEIPDESNSGDGVWADSAYRSGEMERKLREKGCRSEGIGNVEGHKRVDKAVKAVNGVRQHEKMD